MPIDVDGRMYSVNQGGAEWSSTDAGPVRQLRRAVRLEDLLQASSLRHRLRRRAGCVAGVAFVYVFFFLGSCEFFPEAGVHSTLSIIILVLCFQACTPYTLLYSNAT